MFLLNSETFSKQSLDFTVEVVCKHFRKRRTWRKFKKSTLTTRPRATKLGDLWIQSLVLSQGSYVLNQLGKDCDVWHEGILCIGQWSDTGQLLLSIFACVVAKPKKDNRSIYIDSSCFIAPFQTSPGFHVFTEVV